MQARRPPPGAPVAELQLRTSSERRVTRLVCAYSTRLAHGDPTSAADRHGSAPSITDLRAGTIPVAVDTLGVLLPRESGGKIRILAIAGTAGTNRSPQGADLSCSTARRATHDP
ncbi:MAG: hypothetical protein H3C59_15895 [Burkholderiaceae bacterium]|nr:hypothetical protein [Burkholderiaceae bacterium]